MSEDRKVTLTFTLPWTADVEKVDEETVSLLIRDALYEFYRVGSPSRESAEAYVEKRYATFSAKWKEEKVKEVQNRVKLAKGLVLEGVSVRPAVRCCDSCGIENDYAELFLVKESPSGDTYHCEKCRK